MQIGAMLSKNLARIARLATRRAVSPPSLLATVSPLQSRHLASAHPAQMPGEPHLHHPHARPIPGMPDFSGYPDLQSITNQVVRNEMETKEMKEEEHKRRSHMSLNDRLEDLALRQEAMDENFDSLRFQSRFLVVMGIGAASGLLYLYLLTQDKVDVVIKSAADFMNEVRFIYQSIDGLSRRHAWLLSVKHE